MPDDETRFTLWFEVDDDLNVDDVVLASGLTRSAAAKIVREHENSTPLFHAYDYATFRCFELIHFRAQSAGGLRTVIASTVPKTGDMEADRRLALEMIDVQTLDRHREFWRGRISTDDDFKERLERIAERRAIQALDREIATKLVDTLLTHGYTITCCIRDDVPEFNHSTDREGILDLLFDLEMAELHVHKEGKRAWIMLVFFESGWDVVADYSSSLESLIDPIVDPYLPWNQPDADPRDRGYEVFVLPSTDARARGDEGAQRAFDGFVRALHEML